MSARSDLHGWSRGHCRSSHPRKRELISASDGELSQRLA
jgi:hypothetical protein